MANSLEKEIFEHPYSFEFFQAVRVLDRMYPDARPVGRDALPVDEGIRFRSHIALDFPASEVQELRETADDNGRRRVEMIVNFMGMVGPSGVLPVHYTELVLDRIRHRDTAMWAFLDIFTHRAVSMFHRAWSKYRFPVGYERGEDEFTAYLFDLIGLGTKGLRNRLNLNDQDLLPYSGLIAQKPHSANAVENVLSDYFGTTAKLCQFYGQWLVLEPADLTRVGQANSELGVNTIAGSRIWDQQSKFRVRLGPLTFEQFQAFLPTGTAYRPLGSIIRLMVGEETDYDVQLILQARQVPSTVLTTRAKRRPMLGWTSFLKSEPFENDDEQVTLSLDV